MKFNLLLDVVCLNNFNFIGSFNFTCALLFYILRFIVGLVKHRTNLSFRLNFSTND